VRKAIRTAGADCPQAAQDKARAVTTFHDDRRRPALPEGPSWVSLEPWEPGWNIWICEGLECDGGTENATVTAVDELTTLYARPLERVLRKEIDHVDATGCAFIAASPFLVLATGSSQGLDCSPKGDKPGFVQVENDGRTLLIPDRRGNNRIDTLKNLVEDPRIGLIFLVPGANETYRVNGRAQISIDPILRRRFAVDGKEPATVIVVAVEQAFQHCPKALVRSDLWKAGSVGRPTGVPTLGDFAAARTPGTDSVTYDAEYARRMPSELY